MPKKKKKVPGSEMDLDESLGTADEESEAPVGKKVVPSSVDADDDLLEESADDDEDDLLLATDDEEEEEVY